MIRFRYHSAVAVMALLAVVGASPFLLEGIIALTSGEFSVKSLLILVPLVPLVIAIWAWRTGTDANEYGIKVKALLGRRIIPWTQVSALAPDGHGRTLAVLNDGNAVRLAAVKPADLPRLAATRVRAEAETAAKTSPSA